MLTVLAWVTNWEWTPVWRTRALIPEADEEVGTVKEKTRSEWGGLFIQEWVHGNYPPWSPKNNNVPYWRWLCLRGSGHWKKKNGEPKTWAPSQCIAFTSRGPVTGNTDSSCFGWDVDFLMSGARKIMFHPYHGMTPPENWGSSHTFLPSSRNYWKVATYC